MVTRCVHVVLLKKKKKLEEMLTLTCLMHFVLTRHKTLLESQFLRVIYGKRGLG